MELYQQGLAIFTHLADEDKTNSDWQRDLSVGYNKVGDVLAIQSRLQDALDAYRESLAIAKRLAEEDESNSVWQRDLSVSYSNVGDILDHFVQNSRHQNALLTSQPAQQSSYRYVWSGCLPRCASSSRIAKASGRFV
jgi:hypothetical protein